MGCQKLTYLENFPELKVEQGKNFAREKTGVRVLYFGARYYDSVPIAIGMSVWLSVDPLADKYPSMSPFMYTAGNLVMLVDPDGKKIWIFGKGQNKVDYSIGMNYEGNNKFIGKTFNILNKISKIRAGEIVLKCLIKSENDYNLINKTPVDKKGNKMDAAKYERIPGGGANIWIGMVMNQGSFTLSSIQIAASIGHELFHGYQEENNQNAATINGEVGAYLFQQLLKFKLRGGAGSLGTNSVDGKKYSRAMDGLLFFGFNRKKYETALKYFKSGSRANNGSAPGIYKYHKIDENYTPLIKNFLPI